MIEWHIVLVLIVAAYCLGYALASRAWRHDIERVWPHHRLRPRG